MIYAKLRMGCRASLVAATAMLGTSLIAGAHAAAQSLPNPRILPGQERLPVPPPERPPAAPSVLPPAPVPSGESESSWARGMAVYVGVIEILGNTVLPTDAIERVTLEYVGRKLVSEDLLDLQRRLTRLYVDAGYVTSFATLPDQDVALGVLRVQIVEGRLGEVVIEGLRGFDAHFIERRLAPERDAPLDVERLEHRLQVLQLDPRIGAVKARLSATTRPGVSRLDVEIVEVDRVRAQAVVSNDRPPAIGQTNGRLGVGVANLAGWGDDYSLTGVFSQGLQEVAFDASVPVTRFDTVFATRLRYIDSEVVDSVFAPLDIDSSYWSVALALQQPVWRTTRFDWRAAVAGELRQSKTTLGGEPIATGAASTDGKLRVAVLRFSTQAVYRDLSQVLAARTQVSVGLPILGASVDSSGVDDSQFVSWLGQLQWARRLPLWHLEVLSRLDWQLAWAPLPPIERFAVGGINSVRGYTENRLVRDNGITGSVELRLPIVRSAAGRTRLAVASFVDAGRSWFHDRGPTPEPKNLAGAGLGLLFSPQPWFDTRVYWGAQLVSVAENPSGLQGQGLYFSVTLKTF